MNHSQKLIEVLTELKSAAMSITNELEYRETVDKYDIMFVGSKFNKINTMELRHSLSKVFHYEISTEDMINEMPKVLSSLEMKFEALVLAEDHSKLAGYYVELF
ncbi:hypothetical protein [Niallia nealsonii]|uniref:Uncharacterized protein n=1 Tax=Niallia nealsonii TaxID=115979 RepID=A0A2N0Z343_9BACI|nr:hypothetical protein [Niallia nealsonii]PKG23924.1 hypothetical protein CWS01_09125 [Niallia nealsonii]